jgi:hypothetical protein
MSAFLCGGEVNSSGFYLAYKVTTAADHEFDDHNATMKRALAVSHSVGDKTRGSLLDACCCAADVDRLRLVGILPSSPPFLAEVYQCTNPGKGDTIIRQLSP